MITDVHHVSFYGMERLPLQNFLDKYFGVKPMKLESLDEPPTSPTPVLTIYQIGPSLLEFMQPKYRFGIQYDYIRRAGGPVISHVAWKVENISKWVSDIMSRGSNVWWTEPGTSPHGGYHFDNIFAETTRGVKFQFAEDFTEEERQSAEKQEYRTHTTGNKVVRYVASKAGVKGDEKVDAHRWLVRKQEDGILEGIHHVCYHMWGLDYMVDYLDKTFQMKPFKREDLPERGLRGAFYRFGPNTVAQFEEPTRFGHPNAEYALGFGPHAGYVGGGVSHVGWAVKGIDKLAVDLKKAGVKFVQDKPVVSPHGGYKLIDAVPEMAGGVKFQLCEDL